MIPATPAKTGGAGTGNLNAANTTPHPKPVIIDKIISFMLFFLDQSLVKALKVFQNNRSNLLSSTHLKPL